MFNSLQIGRAIAALLVVLHHATLDSTHFYGNVFNNFWIFGNIGVDFFFVLSGFIIYWAHRKDDQGGNNAKTYAYKRLIRIYPPFILISAVMYLAYIFLPGLSEVEREIGALSSFLLIPQEYASPALSVSWTLMHELLFYCVFLIFYFNRKILPLAFTLWAIAILVYPWLGFKSFWGDFLLSMHNIQFLLGVVLSYFIWKYDQIIEVITANKIYPTLLLFFSLLILTFLLSEKAYISNVLPYDYYTLWIGLGFFSLIFSLLVTEKALLFKGVFNSKVLLFLGAASYSIYLFHNPAISILNRFFSKILSVYPMLNLELIFILIVAIATIGGIFYYILWERPALNVMNKLIFPKGKKSESTNTNLAKE